MTQDQALLKRAIKASGLSARQFARYVVLRHERTVRRWQDGSTFIPGMVREKLQHYLANDPEPVALCQHKIPTFAHCEVCEVVNG